MGQMTAEAFMDLARSALAELPDDAVLEPLDYETGHSRADS